MFTHCHPLVNLVLSEAKYRRTPDNMTENLPIKKLTKNQYLFVSFFYKIKVNYIVSKLNYTKTL